MRRSRAVPAPAGKASRLGRSALPGLLAGLMACAPKRGMKSRSCHEVRCDIEVLLETARDAGAVSGSMEGNVFETSGNACPGSSARRHLPQNGARTGAERPAPVRNRCGRRRGRGFQFAGTSTGVRAGARSQAARPRRPDGRSQGPGVQEAGACPAVSAVSAGTAGTGSPAVAAGSAEPAFLNWQNCFGNVFLLFPQRAAVLQACAPPCHLPGPGLRRSGLKLAERSVSSRSGVPAACSLAGGRDRAGELCGSGMLFAFQIRALRSLAPPGLPESFPAWRPSADCRTFPISRSARAAPAHRHVLLKLRAWQPR